MIKRLNAFRMVFNFLLSIVELLVGMHFLVDLFGSSGNLNDLVETVQTTLEQSGVFVSQPLLLNSGIEEPVAWLLMVLGFMLFSFVLITIVPAMVERKEKELELIDDEW